MPVLGRGDSASSGQGTTTRNSSRGSSRGSNRPPSGGYDFTAAGEKGEYGSNYVPGQGKVLWNAGTFPFDELPFDAQEAVFRFLTAGELAVCRQTCESWSVVYEGAVSRMYADFCKIRKPSFPTVQEELHLVHRIRNLHRRTEAVQAMMWAAARDYHQFATAALDRIEGSGFVVDELCVADGTTPLHVACRNNNTKTMEVLLDRGADPNALDIRGQTPAHGAAVKRAGQGLMALLRTVQAMGGTIDLDRSNSQGRTMLYEACGRGYVEIARALLKAGGRAAPGDDARQEGEADGEGAGLGEVPAVGSINVEASTAPLGTLKKPELGTSLCVAAANGRAECVKLLLRHGANVGALSTDKRSPLYLAAEGGHLQCMRAILDLRPPSANREQEIEEAEKKNFRQNSQNEAGDAATGERAVPFSVDIDQQGDSGKTPLFIASENGHVAPVSALVAAGANVSIPTFLNKTPLYMASEQGHTDIVKILLSKSSSDDVMRTTNYGTTALFIAQRHGHKAISNLLTDFCSNHMKQAVQRASTHSNGSKLSAKTQKDYMAKLTTKYNTLEKERSLLVDAAKTGGRGGQARDLSDDIAMVSRKLKQVEEEMRRKPKGKAAGKGKKKAAGKGEASAKKRGDGKKGSGMQIKRRTANAYAKIDSSVLRKKGGAAGKPVKAASDDPGRKRLAQLEKALKDEKARMARKLSAAGAAAARRASGNGNAADDRAEGSAEDEMEQQLRESDEKMEKIMSSVQQRKPKGKPKAREKRTGNQIERAAATLKKADEVLKRARSPEMERPAERRPTSGGSTIREAPRKPAREEDEAPRSPEMAAAAAPPAPPTPRRSHERLREAQAWSKAKQGQAPAPPPAEQPQQRPEVERPSKRQQQKNGKENKSHASAKFRKAEKLYETGVKVLVPKPPNAVKNKIEMAREKSVRAAWSCLAGRGLSSIHRCLLRFSKSTSGFLISKPLLAYIFGASPDEIEAIFSLLSDDQDDEEKDDKDQSIDAFECFVATTLLASGPMEDRLRFCFGLFDREGTNKLSKRHVGMLVRCCLASVAKLHHRTTTVAYLNKIGEGLGVSDLVESAFDRAARKRRKKGAEFDPDTMSAKQFARWALDSKKPAPFVQALYDLVSAIS